MWIVILSGGFQPRTLQLPTGDEKLRTVQYDDMDALIQDLRGKFIGKLPSVPGKDLSTEELEHNIWGLNITTGESLLLNDLIK
jgi:hypothetical protein